MVRCKLRPQLRSNFLYTKPHIISAIVFIFMFFISFSTKKSVEHAIITALFIALFVFLLCYLFYKNIKTIEADGFESIEIDMKNYLIKFDDTICLDTGEIDHINIIDSPVPKVLKKIDHYNPIINMTLVFHLKNSKTIDFHVQNTVHYNKIIDLLNELNIRFEEKYNMQEENQDSPKKNWPGIIFGTILIILAILRILLKILKNYF